MLERLDDIPWAALEHAYGSAADVPDQIRALRSPQPKVREGALWHLWGNIFHQGTRYEASAFAVPFLFDLVADPATPQRANLASMILAMAVGFDEAWLPEPMPMAEWRAETAEGVRLLQAAPLAAEARTEYWKALGSRERDLADEAAVLVAYDAVLAGLPQLCTLLTDDDPQLRSIAAYTLGWLGERAEESVPALTAAAGDPEPTVAATALVALGLLGTDDPAARQRITAALTDARAVVRWGAAVALARLHGPQAGAEVVAELLAWAGGDSEPHAGIPCNDGDLAGYAALALEQVGPMHEDAVFDALLARIPAVSGQPALQVVGEALRLAFPTGKVAAGTAFADLDERQQRLLRTLVDSPRAWMWDEHTAFGNFSSMVAGYGLGSDVGQLRAYLT